MNPTSIGRTLNLDRKTVRRYLRAATPDDLLAPVASRGGPLAVHKPYLNHRFTQGCTNAVRLWEEIRDLGYRGSQRTVRRYLNTLRTGTAKPDRPADLTVRQVRAWIMRRPDRLDERDQQRLDALCTRSPILAATKQLVHGFAARCGSRSSC